MTVQELISKLAGLPPQMSVWIDADGTSMFLNEVDIEARDRGGPICRIHCGTTWWRSKDADLTYEERLAVQKQRMEDLT